MTPDETAAPLVSPFQGGRRFALITGAVLTLLLGVSWAGCAYKRNAREERAERTKVECIPWIDALVAFEAETGRYPEKLGDLQLSRPLPEDVLGYDAWSDGSACELRISGYENLLGWGWWSYQLPDGYWRTDD